MSAARTGFQLWQRRELIQQLITREVQQRYRESYLGALWSLATPLLLLAVYTFVFSVVFKGRWGADRETSPTEYALTLLAGLIPFNIFAEMMNRAPLLVLNVPNYVKRVTFPLEILPLVALGSALANALPSFGVLLAASALLLGRISSTIVFLPFAFVPLLLLSLGVGWLLASLGVYFRDLAQGIPIATQVVFFLSPVFYPVSAVPPHLQPLLYANPLTTILSSFRRTLLWNDTPAWGALAAWSTVTGVFAVVTYVWFTKTKAGFADLM